MSIRPNHVADAIGLFLAVLYTVAGQAHFTLQITPDLAANIEVMTDNTYAAFGGLGLAYVPFKQLLGSFDLAAAVLLWRRPTRKAGLWTAGFGFGGGLYGQLITGQDLSQVGTFLALAFAGLVCSPLHR